MVRDIKVGMSVEVVSSEIETNNKDNNKLSEKDIVEFIENYDKVSEHFTIIMVVKLPRFSINIDYQSERQ